MVTFLAALLGPQRGGVKQGPEEEVACCCGTDICVSPNPYVKALAPDEMSLEVIRSRGWSPCEEG